MPKRNIEDVYNILYDMMESADKLIDQANNLTTAVAGYGGDLKRVITEQMGKYFIPTLQKLKDDENTPGCIKAQLTYLDSIPLWQTRVEADPAADYQPDLERLPTPEVSMPASSSIDNTQNIPQNTSYQNPNGVQQPYQESKEEEPSKYRVVRLSNYLSSLGDLANLSPSTVGEYDCKEEAERHCKALNDSITEEEKDLLGTKYEIKELKFKDGKVQL